MLKTRFISSHIAGSHETRARVMPLIYYLLMAGRQSSSRIPELSMEQYCIFQQVAPIGGRVTWRASWAGGQKRVAGWEQKLKFRWQKPQQSRNYDVFCGVCGFLCGRSWCLEASVGWQRRQVKKKKGERKRRRKKKEGRTGKKENVRRLPLACLCRPRSREIRLHAVQTKSFGYSSPLAFGDARRSPGKEKW